MLRAEVNFSQWINQKIWPKVCVLPRWVTKRNHTGKVETPYLSPSSQHLLLTSSFFHSYLCVFLWSKIYFCLLCKFKFPLGFIWSDRIFCTFIPKEKRVSRNQKEKKKEYPHLSEWLNWKINRQAILSTDTDVEQPDLSRTAGGNAKRHSPFGNSLMVSSKFKHPLAMWPNNLTAKHLPKKSENIYKIHNKTCPQMLIAAFS